MELDAAGAWRAATGRPRVVEYRLVAGAVGLRSHAVEFAPVMLLGQRVERFTCQLVWMRSRALR